MFNVADAKKQRAEFRQKAIAAVELAIAEKRDLTVEEQATYDKFSALCDDITIQLHKHDQGKQLVRGGPVIGPGRESEAPMQGFDFPGLAEFMQDGTGGIKASLSEGGDLQFLVPQIEVEGFRAAYPGVDPFAQAGASITQLDAAWVDGRIPFVLGGAEPSVYSEGDGPDQSEDAPVKVIVLDDPDKHAFLTKPTEEALDDIPTLARAIGAEGLKRILNKQTKAVTTALLASLATASATVQHLGDNLEDGLNLLAAIPSFFASDSNVFMGSRRTLALMRNTRVGADNLPAFDPTTGRFLGYKYVVNDYVGDGKLLFGDFSNGVHIRRSAFHFQQLTEVYREAGKVGFRFYQRSQSAFFSDAAAASVSEQPIYLLTSDFGS